MAHATVDTEFLMTIGHKLVVSISDMARGFDSIADELEFGSMSRQDIGSQVRELANYAKAMAKELSQ